MPPLPPEILDRLRATTALELMAEAAADADFEAIVSSMGGIRPGASRGAALRRHPPGRTIQPVSRLEPALSGRQGLTAP